MRQHEIFERPLRPKVAEIEHHGHIRQLPGRDSTIDGIPLGTPVMSGLDPHDHAAVFADSHGRQSRIHVGEILFERPAFHAGSHDVDEGEHARKRPIDDLRFELREIAPPRAPDVHDRRDSRTRRVRIGLHSDVPVAEVSVVGAVEDVRVEVNQPGNDVQAVRVGHAAGTGRVDLSRHFSDLAARDRHVHHRIDSVPWIDDMASTNQEVESRLLRKARRQASDEESQ